VELDDPDFEEDLKQFQLRLSSVIFNDQVYAGGRKLKPNVSKDWLLTIREKSKSLSYNMPKPPSMTLVA
jgi:hypothetical protein